MYDIYSNARSDSWRFTLGKSGVNPLLTIGLNPSTATREKADTTVAKVEKVAKQYGFDGFVMFNLYPVRATDFRDLPRKVNREAFEENIAKIEGLVAALRKPTVWAAWGTCVTHHTYFLEARDELIPRLAKHGVKWVCHGPPTQNGHPRHPSRLRYAWSLAAFDPVEGCLLPAKAA
jgi:hypothetical protein